MLRFLYSLYSFWMVLLFFLMTPFMLFFFILCKLLLPYPKQIVGVYFINRTFIFFWSVFTGIRYQITGLENIKNKQTYVCVLNHTNSADMIAAAYGARVFAKPLVKKSLTLIPFLGQIFSLSCIAVDRSSPEARKKSKENMLSDLKQSISILIFPEGTRNRTGKPLKDFFDGAFDIAAEANLPIMPIVFTNIRNINPQHDLVFQPETLEINHLPPIFPTGSDAQAIHLLKEETFKSMWNFLVEHDDNFKKFELL
jgi:1-acyl-sn-glycerol-3-phosphate acyltransferase